LLHFRENTINELSFPTIKTNKKITYLNTESAFDIETTSTKIQGEKTAFMYIWMFGLGFGNNIYYGRTWDDFLNLIKQLQIHFNLGYYKRLVVYVHNLGYEFQFMRKYFKWEEVFAVGERKPIKALCEEGIEFRDSYILSGYSLGKTAENLQYNEVEKLTGDLDYSLIRTPETVMQPQEMAYCHNDIEIILAYINEQIHQYKDITKIPLTNTGRVRKYVRDNCYYTNSNHRKSSKGKYYKYRKLMQDLKLSVEEYKMLKRAFMGGFTHANANHTGKVLKDVSSIDFTSSYPSVMLAEQYPMSKGKQIDVNSIDELEYYCHKYCLLFNIRLTNVESSISQENYISESKCFELSNPILNNGRVYSASSLAMTITNVDFDIIKQCYDWEDIEVSNVIRYHKGYLPKSIISSILELYKDKTVLKGVEGYEIEYLLSKGMLNSVYGMSVTDIVKDNHIYDDNEGWEVEPVTISDEIEKYNESKNRFLYYPWGVWVTAYARKNLWTGIIALGNDYVYSDTDSIKMINYSDNVDYIEWYNKQTMNKLNRMCDVMNIDKSLLEPKTKEGTKKPIGVWDFEGTYKRFKTLGAKRYLVQENDELHLTIAGLSKQNGIEYMKEKSGFNYEKVFDMFNDELYIPAERTGKMTHTYIDNEQQFRIQDYQGNDSNITTKSSINLEPADFTLSISRQYGRFLQFFLKGYLYKGVNEI